MTYEQANTGNANPYYSSLINKLKRDALTSLSAEREGFEPPVPLSTSVFKTGAIDHSATSPKVFVCGNVVLPVLLVQRYAKKTSCARKMAKK